MEHVAKSLLWLVMVPLPLAYGVPTALASMLPINVPPAGGSRALGAVIAAAGTVGLLLCFLEFIRRGRGTPAPYAPPRDLVAAGLYRYSRNPMYLSVLITIIGQGLYWGSWPIWAYSVTLGLALHGWVVLIEEPSLRDRFGDQYEIYVSSAPRWVGVPGTKESA